MIDVCCPKCEQQLSAPQGSANQVMRCPACGTKINIPDEAPAISEKPLVMRKAIDDEAGDQPLSRRAKKIDREDLIDMTAMVDIVFFLLIFFLVTSFAGIQSSVPMPRPETHSDEGGASALNAEMPENNSSDIIVRIGKTDSIEIDGVQFNDLSDLAVRLKQLRTSQGADATMLVIGHADATHGTAVSVLDAGYEAGISRLRLAVLDDKPE